MKLIYSAISLLLASVLTAAPALEPAEPSSGALTVHATAGKDVIDVQVSDESGAPVRDAAVIVRLPDDPPTGTFANGSHAEVAYTDGSGQAHMAGIHWTASEGAVPIQITATKGDLHAGTMLEQAVNPEKSGAAPHRVVKAAASKSAANVGVPASASPASPQPPPPATAQPEIPRVTVISHPTDQKISSGSHKKWVIIALAVGAGAGAAFAFSSKKSSSSSSASTTGTTIGSPTVSVGQP